MFFESMLSPFLNVSSKGVATDYSILINCVYFAKVYRKNNELGAWIEGVIYQ